MASEIGIPIVVTQDGLPYIRQAADDLDALGAAGQQSSQGTNAAAGGLNSLVKGGADMVMSIQGAIGILNGAGGLISTVDQLGVSSLRTKEALGGVSNGQTVQYMDALRTSTHGLVDDMTLATVATKALATGVASTPGALAKIAEEGSTLAMVFQGAADGGAALVQTLEMVGNTRGLKQLGVDIPEVKLKFEDLKKSGMDAATAWNEAVMGGVDATFNKLGADIESGPGTAVDRLNARMKNFMAYNGERVAIGIDATLNLIEAVGGKIGERLALGTGNGTISAPGDAAFNAQYSGIVAQSNKDIAEAQMRQQLQLAAAASQMQDAMVGQLAPTASSARNREALLDASSNTSFTADEASARGNAAGGYNVAASFAPQSDRMAQMADAAQRTQAAMDQAANSTRRGADAASDFDFQLQNMSNNAHGFVANFQSVSQAFGLGGANPIYGQVGAGLSGDVSQMRAKLQAQLQKEVGTVQGDGTGSFFSGGSGGLSAKQSAELDKYNNQLELTIAHHDDLGKVMAKSKTITETQTVTFDQQAESIAKLRGEIGKLTTTGSAGGGGGGHLFTKDDMQRQLDAFDTQSKDAVDQWKIATGQATPESVAFQNAIDKINKSVTESKISLPEATREFKDMADTIKAGHTSLADINALTGGMTGTGGQTPIHAKGGMFADGAGPAAAGGATARGAAADPLAPLRDGMDKTIAKTTDVNTATASMGPTTDKAVAQASAGVMRLTSQMALLALTTWGAVAAQRALSSGGGGHGP